MDGLQEKCDAFFVAPIGDREEGVAEKMRGFFGREGVVGLLEPVFPGKKGAKADGSVLGWPRHPLLRQEVGDRARPRLLIAPGSFFVWLRFNHGCARRSIGITRTLVR